MIERAWGVVPWATILGSSCLAGLGTACSSSGQTGGHVADAQSNAPTACSANITISNVAFYGSSVAGTSTVCPTAVVPSSAAITGNNNSESNGTIFYGSAPDQWSTFTGRSSGEPSSTLSFVPTSAGFNFIATVMPSSDGSYSYNTVGLTKDMNECVNASGYAGVSFTIAGDVGSCFVYFIVVSAEDDTPNFGGTCTGSLCYAPAYKLTTTGDVSVPFTSFTGGMPMAAVDPTSILNLQWQVTFPSGSGKSDQ
jgi:hypothetical protein